MAASTGTDAAALPGVDASALLESLDDAVVAVDLGDRIDLGLGVRDEIVGRVPVVLGGHFGSLDDGIQLGAARGGAVEDRADARPPTLLPLGPLHGLRHAPTIAEPMLDVRDPRRGIASRRGA